MRISRSSEARPSCPLCRPQPGDKWYLDEVFIRIQGVQHYLWRAVDRLARSLTEPGVDTFMRQFQPSEANAC
jgi:hypothetical protein